jgi:hypothetical protein
MLQNPTDNSQKEANSILLTHKYMDAHFSGWEQTLQLKMAELNSFMGSNLPADCILLDERADLFIKKRTTCFLYLSFQGNYNVIHGSHYMKSIALVKCNE